MKCLIKDLTPLQVMEQLDLYGQHHRQCEATEALWRMLTALRGPDNEDVTLKSGTTGILREAMVPNLAYFSGGVTTPHKPEELEALARFYDTHYEDYGGPHFSLHVQQAAQAILWFRLQLVSPDALIECPGRHGFRHRASCGCMDRF